MKKYHADISNSYIGQKMRKRRLQMGLTGDNLGKQSGLSQQQISRYERGVQNFTIRRLCIFANILQCDLNYFLEQNYTEIDVTVDQFF
ncbi:MULTISPECIES: helix-turn-helix domain-containing protein [Providencia]|uniref:helix-turn-helix domain-containing protein n=1 Tax=Providencia TaxID=586 RepID=UPI001C5A9F93|nr:MULTISPECIES: helix-turn-helix transcriptional regulator [Providencia]QXX82699.1 helix-turn-helix transcriptional regulator [Providencia sp. R33]